MLGQADIAKYLDQCEGSKTAIEEVLSGYIVWKYLRGATSARVLGKLRYLTIYLRVTGRGHIIEEGADVFKILMLEVAGGGGRIGLLPAQTVPGKAVWNAIRRAASLPLVTDSVYGGPGPVHAFLSFAQSQPLPHNETRTPWSEQYFQARVQLGEVPGELPAYSSGNQMTLPLYTSHDHVSANQLVSAN
ncbi:hypothetical protein MSAN_01571000 [Mycena sanguinolenta]|uniref:Uncharacterized protein n=1 Tax=Mycena sanguinolenta TaxID=230812 RepID=A0A8H6XZV1_9AGAR|nr:hypothetical protein MSAN_01571000 [Mycena sanguinolenta]